VQGDRELLAQAISNLLENALKYGQPEGDLIKPAIKVKLIQKAEQVILNVADNGRGIPEADRERVCNRFVRLDAARNEPGSGLGLALIKAVVTLHHGELRLNAANTLSDSEDKISSGLLAQIILPAANGKPGEGEGREKWDKDQRKNATR